MRAADRPTRPIVISLILGGLLLAMPVRAAEPKPVHHHPIRHRLIHVPPHPRPAMHRPAGLVRHPPMRPVRPVVVPPVAAPEPVVPPVAAKGSSTGLPLPRYASLRADAVNLRGGPGTRYPIQWVYRRRDLPVRIEREFDVWRLIEDADGVKGWVHQATLVGTRTFMIPGAAETDADPAASGMTATGTSTAAPTTPISSVVGRYQPGSGAWPAELVPLRARPEADAPLVALLKPGIVGRIRACPANPGWCKVAVRDVSGWLPRQAFWGLLPDEIIQP